MVLQPDNEIFQKCWLVVLHFSSLGMIIRCWGVLSMQMRWHCYSSCSKRSSITTRHHWVHFRKWVCLKIEKPSNLMRTDKLFIGSPIEVAICWPYPMFRHTTLFLLKTTVRHGGKQTAGPGRDVPQSTVNECGLDDSFDGFAAETSRSYRLYCRHPPKFIQHVSSKAFWATLG